MPIFDPTPVQYFIQIPHIIFCCPLSAYDKWWFEQKKSPHFREKYLVLSYLKRWTKVELNFPLLSFCTPWPGRSFSVVLGTAFSYFRAYKSFLLGPKKSNLRIIRDWIQLIEKNVSTKPHALRPGFCRSRLTFASLRTASQLSHIQLSHAILLLTLQEYFYAFQFFVSQQTNSAKCTFFLSRLSCQHLSAASRVCHTHSFGIRTHTYTVVRQQCMCACILLVQCSMPKECVCQKMCMRMLQKMLAAHPAGEIQCIQLFFFTNFVWF